MSQIGSTPAPATQDVDFTPGTQRPAPAMETVEAAKDFKLAGKYSSPEALTTATREIATKLGVPLNPDQKIVGEGGLYADIPACEQAYLQMQKQLGSPTRPDLVARQQETPAAPTSSMTEADSGLGLEPPETPAAGPIDLEKAVTDAGLNVKELIESMQSKGQLDDHHYTRLNDQFQKQGGRTYDKWAIDQIAKGKVAEYQSAERQVQGLVKQAGEHFGGVEQWENVRSWAKGHYSPEMAKSLQDRLHNPATIGSALSEIQRDHAQATGSAGSNPLITGGQNTQPPGPSFRTKDDLVKFQSSKGYDPARYTEAEKAAVLRASQELNMGHFKK